MCVCVCVCVCVCKKTFGCIPYIVSFVRSSRKDVQVFALDFLLLCPSCKERILYLPKRFQLFRWSSSGIVSDHLLQ